MSKRKLFEELSTALVEAKQYSEGKLTLRTHIVERTGVPMGQHSPKQAGAITDDSGLHAANNASNVCKFSCKS
jgi:putative transcriptional regulator